MKKEIKKKTKKVSPKPTVSDQAHRAKEKLDEVETFSAFILSAKRIKRIISEFARMNQRKKQKSKLHSKEIVFILFSLMTLDNFYRIKQILSFFAHCLFRYPRVIALSYRS